MKKITFLDILISFVFITAITVLFILNFIHKKDTSSYLLIDSPEGKYSYSINQNKIVDIKGETGIVRIAIDNGKFKFIESSCVNKDCVRMGWVSLNNFPVVCLPNKVSAYIKNTDENTNDFDEVTR